MKRLQFFLLALVLCLPMSAWAETLNDAPGGNGTVVEFTPAKIIVTRLFAESDPSTEGGKVKFSIPFKGPKSDGVLLAKGGERFKATLGRSGHADLIAYATAGPGGKGPLVFEFTNPTKDGDPEVNWVFNDILENGEKQTVCPAWTNLVYFGTPNANHPKGQHTTMFAGSGIKVRAIVNEMRQIGFIPAAEFHGIKTDPPWTLKNLATGTAPEGSAPPTKKAP